jgi:hypothetical protein
MGKKDKTVSKPEEKPKVEEKVVQQEKPKPGKIYVNADPKTATIKILNIKPMFSQGIELSPGMYHIEVSASGYITKREWIHLGSEENKKVRIHLAVEKKKVEVAIKRPPRPTISGSQEMGKDGNFVKSANGVVKDTRTGLEWYAGPDRNVNWNEADTWVRGLMIDGDGWRMPTINELRGLYEKGKGNRNMTPLLKTTGWHVWSGETKSSCCFWRFSFLHGSENYYKPFFSYKFRAFAVRSR